jgi:hypothetical protein
VKTLGRAITYATNDATEIRHLTVIDPGDREQLTVVLAEQRS